MDPKFHTFHDKVFQNLDLFYRYRRFEYVHLLFLILKQKSYTEMEDNVNEGFNIVNPVFCITTKGRCNKKISKMLT